MHRRAALQSIAASALVGLLPAASAAYTLPASAVFKRASRRLARSAGARITLDARARRPDGVLRLTERWAFEPARSAVRVSDGERDASWTRSEGEKGVVDLLPPAFARAVLTALFGRGDVSGLARELGVDTRLVALGLADDRVAYVVGGAPREPGPRLWIDKEDHAVLRVRSGTRDEVRLTRWSEPPGFGRFPTELRITVAGRFARALRTETVNARG